jgi:hypothetical protein
VAWDAERVGVTAIALSGLVFGLHSAIDWTWFVPGCAVMGIFAAGFVAGRGPVAALAGAGGVAVSSRSSLPQTLRGWFLPRDPARAGAAAAVLVAALLAAWAVQQPERSDSATRDALSLVANGNFNAAIAKADKAHSINPLSPKPLLVKSAVQDSAGDKQAALQSLERAVIQQPSNPQLWMKLADYELNRLHNPRASLQASRAVLYLDPLEQSAQQQFLDASAELRGAKRPGHSGAGSSGALGPAPATPPGG